jgi:hypothetical protein
MSDQFFPSAFSMALAKRRALSASPSWLLSVMRISFANLFRSSVTPQHS